MDYSPFITDLNETVDLFFKEKSGQLDRAIDALCASLSTGHKVLIFGNGGSASQAQHFAAELVNTFLRIRAPLPAVALTTNSSTITSIANDSAFDNIFSRQIEALGNKGDAAIGLSTSGTSPNVVHALERAGRQSLTTLALTGKGGGSLLSICDILLDVPSLSTPRIQEVHLLILHILAEEIERRIG